MSVSTGPFLQKWFLQMLNRMVAAIFFAQVVFLHKKSTRIFHQDVLPELNEQSEEVVLYMHDVFRGTRKSLTTIERWRHVAYYHAWRESCSALVSYYIEAYTWRAIISIHVLFLLPPTCWSTAINFQLGLTRDSDHSDNSLIVQSPPYKGNIWRCEA